MTIAADISFVTFFTMLVGEILKKHNRFRPHLIFQLQNCYLII